MTTQDQFQSASDTKKPTAMVLGSSGNIGQAAVTLLLEQGCNVIAADWNNDLNTKAMTDAGLDDAIQSGALRTQVIDARSMENLTFSLIVDSPDLVVSTLPAGELSYNAAAASAIAKKNYVSSNFLTPEAKGALDQKIIDHDIKGIDSFDALLQKHEISSEWERGLDPGLDSWLFHRTLEDFEDGSISTIKSTGAGVAEHPEDTYIYTWAGITNGMSHRPASVIINNESVDIGPRDKFAPDNRAEFEHLELSDGTTIETYANDDGAHRLLREAEALNIDTSNIDLAATLTGRHQGHSALWDPMIRILDLLNDDDKLPENASMKDLFISRIKAIDDISPVYALEQGSQDLQLIAMHILEHGDIDDEALMEIGGLGEALVKNNFLSEEPIATRHGQQTPKSMVEEHLSRIYAREDGKRDRSIIHIEVSGVTARGARLTQKAELNSFGDDTTQGLSSMQKTVAGTLTLSAMQILEGKTEPGLHGAGHNIENGLEVLKAMQENGAITLNLSNAINGQRQDMDLDI